MKRTLAFVIGIAIGAWIAGLGIPTPDEMTSTPESVSGALWSSDPDTERTGDGNAPAAMESSSSNDAVPLPEADSAFRMTLLRAGVGRSVLLFGADWQRVRDDSGLLAHYRTVIRSSAEEALQPWKMLIGATDEQMDAMADEAVRQTIAWNEVQQSPNYTSQSREDRERMLEAIFSETELRFAGIFDGRQMDILLRMGLQGGWLFLNAMLEPFASKDLPALTAGQVSWNLQHYLDTAGGTPRGRFDGMRISPDTPGLTAAQVEALRPTGREAQWAEAAALTSAALGANVRDPEVREIWPQ
jgi:hypothetical protein